METIVKFKEAARLLQDDPRYLALVAARKANDEDEGLQEQIGEFNLLRLDINNEMEKEERNEAHIAQMNERFNALYGQIMSNGNMLAYNEAKQGIEAFINYVNVVLNAAIEGEDPILVNDPAECGCGGGGCSGCAGCG